MFLVLTGANMGGKSTYLRCCALSVLLGQMGSFVPCESARFSLIDGIHTRYFFALQLIMSVCQSFVLFYRWRFCGFWKFRGNFIDKIMTSFFINLVDSPRKIACWFHIYGLLFGL